MDKIKNSFNQRKTEILNSVRRQENPTGIIDILGIKQKNVYNFTFESCSFVIAMKDMKTVIEVCFAPEMINIEEDKTNPLCCLSALTSRINTPSFLIK